MVKGFAIKAEGLTVEIKLRLYGKFQLIRWRTAGLFSWFVATITNQALLPSLFSATWCCTAANYVHLPVLQFLLQL